MRQRPLSGLSFEDLEDYRDFLANPQPAGDWISERKVPLGHQLWRPFNGPLSGASIRQSMVVLATLFAWLVQAGHLASNPFVLLRGRIKGQASRGSSPTRRFEVNRTIPDNLWHEVMCHVKGLQQDAHSNRLRWIVSVFWFGLRISEACQTTMGHIISEQPHGKPLRWWMNVMGKGSKERWIPITPEFLKELERYRLSLGMPALPLPNEMAPLIGRLRRKKGQESPTSSRLGQAHMQRSALHRVIKDLFEQTALRLDSQGDAGGAQLLRLASAHWIRHTSATHVVNSSGMNLASARDLLGHSNLTTTNTYVHAARDRLHEEVVEKHRIGWDAVLQPPKV